MNKTVTDKKKGWKLPSKIDNTDKVKSQVISSSVK